MADEVVPSLETQRDLALDIPFGGLFGDEVIAKVVEELIADPHSTYRATELAELIEASPPRVRTALRSLENIGLLSSDGEKRPVYKINIASKRFVALTLLSFAVLDDFEGSQCMDTAIKAYCESKFGLPMSEYAFTDYYRITANSSADSTYLQGEVNVG